MAEEMLADVEYRDIPGFEGYKIGSDGSVWTCRATNGAGPLRSEWRKLKPLKRPNGYTHVALCPLGGPEAKRRKISIHRTVLEVFVGPCPEGKEACHNNDISDDNRLDNLRWGTKLENHHDRRLNDMIPMGERHYKARLTEADVLSIRQRLADGEKGRDLAKEYRVTPATICSIKQRRIWKHVA
jgi:hypothetical protein